MRESFFIKTPSEIKKKFSINNTQIMDDKPQTFVIFKIFLFYIKN